MLAENNRNIRVQRRCAFTLRAALALASVFVIGRFGVMPAAADFASDSRLCHTLDANKSREKIPACTRVINSGRLSGAALATAYQDRAEGYRLTEQYERALEDFGRAIKINPREPVQYKNRAEVHRLMGNYDQVIADTNQTIRLNPADNAAYVIRGLAYENMGNVAAARADYNKTLSISVTRNDGAWAQDIARKRLQELGN
jgi:tetratricopeptide (TPR) repeat protein